MNTSAIEQVLLTLGKDVIPELEAKLASKCAYCGASVTDIVGNSFTYIAMGVLNGEIKPPETGSDLYRLMALKAYRLIKDVKRSRMTDHGRRSIRAGESLDKVVGDCEREVGEKASYVHWLDACRAEERDYQYTICRKVLESVLSKRKISGVNKRIFKEVFLQERPRDEVAKRYGTTRNNVYRIVFNVKDALNEDGKRIYFKLYDSAA